MYRYVSGLNLGTQLLTANYFNAKDPQSFLSKKGLCSSSFSEAREKLSWEVFPYLLSKISFKPITWKTHRVRSVDGTKITLPRTKEILAKFPIQKSHFGIAHYPKAVLVAASEISSGQITQTRLGNKYLSENETLKEMLHQFKAGDISLLDRGFRGRNLWLKFNEEKQFFVARYKSTGQGIMKEFNPSRRDQTHEIIEKESGRKMSIRIIKGNLSKSGKRIYLITNLLDTKKYKKKELFDLYLKRQVVEESFKQIKKQLSFKLEYRAKKINSFLQEVYAAILAQALTSYLKFKVTTIKKKVISFVGAAYSLEKYFFELLFQNNNGAIIENIIEVILQHYHYRQPGRSYPRFSRQAPKKWISEKRRRKSSENSDLAT